MRDFFKLKTLIITLGIIIVAILISAVLAFFDFQKLNLSELKDNKTAYAAFTDNVSGWAWSENIGWISFNCTNDNPPCGSTNYGVNIDLSGNFSGYAWSPNTGWIDFAPTSGYPSNPQTAAHYDSATGQVTGWAKILSLGDDGWLKMRKDAGDSGPNYGVSINSSGDFSGWAWNGGGIGWVSFNCADAGAGGCGYSYKVSTTAEGIVNNPPTVNTLTAPNLSDDDKCSGVLSYVQLKWTFSDTESPIQNSYQIIFDSASHTPAELDVIADGSGSSLPLNTGKLTGAANSLFPQQNTYRNVALNYNTTYYWWVKVWDDNNNNSGWVAGSSFITYVHEFPDVYLSWSPEKPSKGEEVDFYGEATTYGSSSITTWQWTVPADATIDDSSSQTPKITFNSSGSQSVTLKATDSDGYYCEEPKSVQVNVALPKWKETKK